MQHVLSITRRSLLASSILSLGMPAMASERRPVYRDEAAPIPVRVNDLLSRMTLEEKAAQLCTVWTGKAQLLDAGRRFDPKRAAQHLANGIGQIARPADLAGIEGVQTSDTYRPLPDMVSFVNAFQRYLVEQTRLGIPALLHEELAHGLRSNDATVFPIPPGLASSFDPALVEQVFTIASREARARGITVALTPVLDLLRDPRYGRAEEFFGEDPHLVTQMGLAAVRGIQGRQRPLASDRVFATLKHFVHGVPQGGLNISPAEMSDRMLREAFLLPFATIIKQADPACVMPSYNEVEGIPSHGNADLLLKIGRERLGFRGVYTSDYGGIPNLVTQHHVAATNDEAAILALKAGVQTDNPDGSCFRNLPALIRAGRVPVALVDQAVSAVLALKFEAGLFEAPYVDSQRLLRDTGRPEHRKIAKLAAEKTLTLLKNDGVLPLDPTRTMTLAVIGPNATEPLYGGYSGEPGKGISILQGLRANAPANVTIVQTDGVWITAPDAQGRHRSYSEPPPVSAADNLARIAKAKEMAAHADVVLLVIGDVPAVTREAPSWDQPGDRATLGLWGQQDALVEAMIEIEKPIVALLLNGRPLALPRLAEKAHALIEGWYLGEEGGNAFCDVLFGRSEPGGRLPVSLPRSVGELPVFYNRHPSAYTNHYVEGVPTALYPFGHGLGYTRFDISAPRLSRTSIGQSDTVQVDVDIENIGHRAGEEVVQLYVRDDVSSVPRPILELRAFERLALAPGERKTVRFDLGPDALAFWTIDMEWRVEPGSFTISAGASSASLKSTTLMVIA